MIQQATAGELCSVRAGVARASQYSSAQGAEKGEQQKLF
jgi:hypothetical protein